MVLPVPVADVGWIASATSDIDLALRLLLQLSPPVEVLISALARRGPLYGHLENPVHNDFMVPADLQHREVLELLKKHGHIHRFKKRRLAKMFDVVVKK
ncbi:hypothetical protein ACFWN2_04680 [Lentzea sp. NPDC058436]|uniref:hypothetical protein n=1 Tax=Lentzea sp. NPDC058436 TaxID=3346499 RepID=UPI00366262EA